MAKTNVLILLNNSGNIFGTAQQKALQKYIRKGGGIVAIHGAVATEKKSQWYADIVGGVFKDHPKPQSATITIINRDFKAMQHLDSSWMHFDEWYNLKDAVNAKAVVLATVDEKTYLGGTMGIIHPVVWYQNYDGRRVFTTTLGHTKESYTDSNFVKMIQEAVIWAGEK